MSICDKRGHYYLPIDLQPQQGVFFSILPPAPQKKLYCRRCGKVSDLVIETQWGRTTVSTNTFSTSFVFLHSASSSIV